MVGLRLRQVGGVKGGEYILKVGRGQLFQGKFMDEN